MSGDDQSTRPQSASSGGARLGSAGGGTSGPGAGFRLARLDVRPLVVPLLEPFVIASGRVDATAAVLVEAELEPVGPATGGHAESERGFAFASGPGLGEAATLPPVTDEDPGDVAMRVRELATRWGGQSWSSLLDMDEELSAAFPAHAVTRAGIASALWDAAARASALPLAELFVRELAASLGVRPWQPLPTLTTDITLPIAAPAHMAALASGYWARGFRDFKVKVGRAPADDVAALSALARAVPGARFLLDANGGYRAGEALAVLEAFAAEGVSIACFEQPCAREDWAGMAEVTARSPVPIVADESFRGAADLARILDERAAHAVNLKLAKLGSPWTALRLGHEARRRGLRLMAGAMVETRAGLGTMAHVAAALGGLGEAFAVEWIDLDTAFLMRSDPFDGGWSSQGSSFGPLLTLGPAAGTGLRWQGIG